MADRYPGGVISKTPPTVTPPVAGEGGSASGMWTLDTVLEYEKAGAWPKGILPRELYAWGANTNGQVGDSTTVEKSSPVQIGALTTWDWVAASQTASASVPFSASVKTDGTLWMWGLNGDGQLGQGNTTPRSSPVQVGALTNWSRVEAGGKHTIALKTDGTVWSWGDNYYGQLGLNTSGVFSDRNSPVQVGALTTWTYVGAFPEHSAAIKSDGTLWVWGRNNFGKLGDGTIINRSSPVQIGALTNWAKMTGGFRHSVAVKTDGTIWTWGNNGNGQLGESFSTAIGSSRSSPVQVGSLTNWSTIATGVFHTVAVKTDGTLWAFGYNESGRLGDGTTVNRSSPVQIGALSNWSLVSAGSEHSLSVKTDKTLWAWGNGNSGRLGDGTIVNKSSPIQVGLQANWSRIAAGVNHSLSATKG